MTVANPQVFEPHLDQILAGTLTEPGTLANILRALLITRRRYNDPDQLAGRKRHYDEDGWPGTYDYGNSNTGSDRLGGVPFSNLWTLASQKARVEAGIAFITPLVGTIVGDYPPVIFAPYQSTTTDTTKYRFDAMGNGIPPGMP